MSTARTRQAATAVDVDVSLRDRTVLALCARCNGLPNDLAVVAETELAVTIAHHCTVSGAGAGLRSTAAKGSGGWSGDSAGDGH